MCSVASEPAPASRAEREEFANCVTHGLGLVLSVIAGAALVYKAAAFGDPVRIAGLALYSVSLVSVYAASFLSHWITTEPLRFRARVWDQACIFFVIAGSYTAYACVFMRSPGWWPMHVAMWSFALFGIIQKLYFNHRIQGVSLPLYLMMGWLPIFAAPEMCRLLPWEAGACIIAGGACYSIGTLFLKYDSVAPYMHAAWHLFVIAGSACHYFGVYWYGWG